MHGLTEDDLDIQTRARTFADEVIPYEEQAELAGGELPADLVAVHAARARELGICAPNMPKELGGGGCTTLQQVLVQEQVGRVTNALAWAASTPPSWLPAVATPDQTERYVLPTVRGDRDVLFVL
jgi:alkylation response protein AidB-like acyl-CoA dehydrogenase